MVLYIYIYIYIYPSFDIYVTYVTYFFTAVFSSPCVTEFIKSENLIATEVINRYIRMGSTSPSKIYLNFLLFHSIYIYI